FSIDGASSVGACSISGNLVSFANTGTCIIDANQAGNSDYNAALQVQQIITVNKADQTITFTSTPSPNATIGGTYTVTATGGASGNPVVFSIDAGSTSGACNITGNLVSFTGAGSCIVDANQAGNSNYNAATQAQQIITVNKIDQTITFTSTPTDPAVGGTYTVSATGGASGNPVVFSIDASSSSGACSINGTLVSFTGVGTCIIDANQAGNAQYNAAAQEQQIINLEILPAPYAPSAVMVVPGAGQVTVSWSAPAYTGGSPITGYTVTYGLTGSPTNYNLVANNCNPTSALSCVVTGLSNNTEYSFKVTASSNHGTAAYLAGYSSSVIPINGLAINPSTLALSSLGSGGIARVITLTNTSNSPITLSAVPATYADFTPNLPNDVTIGTTCTTSTPLNANGGFCTITITPGTTASNNNASTPCTGGTAPVASSFQVLPSYSINAIVLGYGCQYQGGYLFSVDDSTSSTANIGGSVAAITPQSNIEWSLTLDSIWGIDDSSLSATPSPNDASLYPATLSLGQTNCNGSNDGACNSNNILDFPNYGTGINYAAGVCYQSIDSAGNSPCQFGNSCFSDWYLPSICEMDDQFIYPDSQSCLLTQSMQSNINTLLQFDNFWSSTEYSLLPQEGAFVEHFNPGASSGTSSPFFKTSFTIGVWCVRRLTL
ncbi:fibronectin type III domain-containing protein, partial [Legionella santicrucis]